MWTWQLTVSSDHNAVHSWHGTHLSYSCTWLFRSLPMCSAHDAAKVFACTGHGLLLRLGTQLQTGPWLRLTLPSSARRTRFVFSSMCLAYKFPPSELSVPCSDLAGLASHLVLLPASDTYCTSNSKSSAARSLGHGRRSRPAAPTYGCMHVVPLGGTRKYVYALGLFLHERGAQLESGGRGRVRTSPLATCSLRPQVALLHERERGPS